jgi:hypothetical protein
MEIRVVDVLDGEDRIVLTPEPNPFPTSFPPDICPEFTMLSNLRWGSDPCTLYYEGGTGQLGGYDVRFVPICDGTASEGQYYGLGGRERQFDVTRAGNLTLATAIYGVTDGYHLWLERDGEITDLLVGNFGISRPALSPDGDSIAFVISSYPRGGSDLEGHGEGINIWRISAGGIVAHRNLKADSISWSTDGRRLVYEDHGSLWIIPATLDSEPAFLAGGSQPAWQPRALPPVLFVHGCGGNLGTWTDPGWIKDATEIAQFTAGGASGKLYRSVIPELPAIPAYALDYSGSLGSIFDLAALIPQSIDKIREETGAEKVMLATHSMGGVLAQAYEGGLASGHGYDDDVAASFMVAPPSKGSFLVNWLTGSAGNALACSQASELGPNSQSMVRLRSAALPNLSYSVVSGTRFWIPFVGLNDGVIADGDVGLNSVAYDKRQVPGIHTDVQLLPNTVAALCQSVLGGPCTPELRMDDVKALFRQRYEEDMFK